MEVALLRHHDGNRLYRWFPLKTEDVEVEKWVLNWADSSYPAYTDKWRSGVEWVSLLLSAPSAWKYHNEWTWSDKSSRNLAPSYPAEALPPCARPTKNENSDKNSSHRKLFLAVADERQRKRYRDDKALHRYVALVRSHSCVACCRWSASK